jgi:glycosyltransferase involved in cell wall biosynthesis
MKLSIVVPSYNERDTITQTIDAVFAVKVDVEKEVIIVDDGSTDGTGDIIASIVKKYSQKSHSNLHVYTQSINQGKGAAVRRGLAETSGDIILIQDSDLEYDPAEYPILIQPILDGKADVVYGSRFISNKPHRVLYNHHYLANKFLTLFSNLFSNLNLSDMETCYKVFSKEAIDSILPCLSSNRFGIEVEITAEIARHKMRVYEVGISYSGRTYEEGKKITYRDGIAALWHILRYNFRTCRKF